MKQNKASIISNNYNKKNNLHILYTSVLSQKSQVKWFQPKILLPVSKWFDLVLFEFKLCCKTLGLPKHICPAEIPMHLRNLDFCHQYKLFGCLSLLKAEEICLMDTIS